jgi:hypothetical protein
MNTLEFAWTADYQDVLYFQIANPLFVNLELSIIDPTNEDSFGI